MRDQCRRYTHSAPKWWGLSQREGSMMTPFSPEIEAKTARGSRRAAQKNWRQLDQTRTSLPLHKPPFLQIVVYDPLDRRYPHTPYLYARTPKLPG